MPEKQRTIYLIAGGNGAGKTTFAKSFLPHEATCLNFPNADLIAQSITVLGLLAKQLFPTPTQFVILAGAGLFILAIAPLMLLGGGGWLTACAAPT